MPARLDLQGQKFGRLEVLSRQPSRFFPKNPKRENTRWLCQCSCGRQLTTFTTFLRQGKTRSCGCLRRENSKKMFSTHGKSKTREWQILQHAKARAKRDGVPFELKLSDINIPTVCPYLGLTINQVKGDWRAGASLDRIDPSKGYVRGNIEVISRLANTMKSNASPEELVRFADSIYARFGTKP